MHPQLLLLLLGLLHTAFTHSTVSKWQGPPLLVVTSDTIKITSDYKLTGQLKGNLYKYNLQENYWETSRVPVLSDVPDGVYAILTKHARVLDVAIDLEKFAQLSHELDVVRYREYIFVLSNKKTVRPWDRKVKLVTGKYRMSLAAALKSIVDIQSQHSFAGLADLFNADGHLQWDEAARAGKSDGPLLEGSGLSDLTRMDITAAPGDGAVGGGTHYTPSIDDHDGDITVA